MSAPGWPCSRDASGRAAGTTGGRARRGWRHAVVDFFGATDFLRMDSRALPGALLKHDLTGSPESRLIGGEIQKNVEKVGVPIPSNT